ncbi:hypothetical protein Q3O43_28455 (plasmid) [Rhodococcus aetherivorans]|uniref:hypothetical protein n=1 Tax=Rhodococcus aetherivorans TaxID=191292 RepID=UPI0026ED0B17|nr:hypothetical protein [Rhodococcus aetherivorans]WKX01710.1 hypothetical protein Q3O43_28455 [Rhodococcus aetherivorans]
MRWGRTRATNTTRRCGHYSPDRTQWYDDNSHRWYPVTTERESLEIELEDVGGTSPVASLFATLTSQFGNASMRFVGRVRGPDGRRTGELVPGETFPRGRSIPDDLPPEEAWSPGMTHSLDDLRRRLTQQGWWEVGRGDQPWSHRYVRPRIDWTHPRQQEGEI